MKRYSTFKVGEGNLHVDKRVIGIAAVVLLALIGLAVIVKYIVPIAIIGGVLYLLYKRGKK